MLHGAAGRLAECLVALASCSSTSFLAGWFLRVQGGRLIPKPLAFRASF